jgi:hypothetical protein
MFDSFQQLGQKIRQLEQKKNEALRFLMCKTQLTHCTYGIVHVANRAEMQLLENLKYLVERREGREAVRGK